MKTTVIGGSDKLSRLLACGLVERVLPIFESSYPKDSRPREAIRISRLYAVGKVDRDTMITARNAASKASDEVLGTSRAAAYVAAAAYFAASDDVDTASTYTDQATALVRGEA